MEPTEVDDKLSVDKDPNVVVPRKRQPLAALIFEPVANLARKSKVMGLTSLIPAAPLDHLRRARRRARNKACVVERKELFARRWRRREIKRIARSNHAETRRDGDVGARDIAIPLPKGRLTCRLRAEGTSARIEEAPVLALSGVHRLPFAIEKGLDQTGRRRVAPKDLEVRMTNAGPGREGNKVPKDDRDLENIAELRRCPFACEADLHAAKMRTSVPIEYVSVIAVLTIARQDDAVSASRPTRARTGRTLGLGHAARSTAVAIDFVAIVATFEPFAHAIATARDVTSSIGAAAPSAFDATRCGTTVALDLVAVIALFSAGDDAVSTSKRDASVARRRTRPTGLELTCRATAIAHCDVGVVALFCARNEPITADDRRQAGITRNRTHKIRLELAKRTASIAAHRIAVIARLAKNKVQTTIAAVSHAIARCAFGRAVPAGLAFTRRATTIARLDVPVVARLEHPAHTVTANALTLARAALAARPMRTRPTRLHLKAVERASVTVVLIAVVAELIRFDPSISAHGASERAAVGFLDRCTAATSATRACEAARTVAPAVRREGHHKNPCPRPQTRTPTRTRSRTPENVGQDGDHTHRAPAVWPYEIRFWHIEATPSPQRPAE